MTPVPIGILEAGRPPPSLEPLHGRYDAMMRRLLGEGFAATTFAAHQGELPDRPDAFAGFLVTGSAAGVYEDLPWIEPLSRFLREARGRAKLVGICFGHQVMAQAFGGRVERSEKGWGLGPHRYGLRPGEPWAKDGADFRIAAFHQDQVVRPPPGARTVAGSAFTPHAALGYEDGQAISFQGHPEFTAAFSRALLGHLTLPGTSAAERDRLAAAYDEPNDAARVAGWIRQFLRG